MKNMKYRINETEVTETEFQQHIENIPGSTTWIETEGGDCVSRPQEERIYSPVDPFTILDKVVKALNSGPKEEGTIHPRTIDQVLTTLTKEERQQLREELKHDPRCKGFQSLSNMMYMVLKKFSVDN